jgi:hypothetical protein
MIQICALRMQQVIIAMINIYLVMMGFGQTVQGNVVDQLNI